MAALSTYLANEILDHTLKNTAYTPPATVYIALFDASAVLANILAGTLTGEISNTGTAYVRKPITFSIAASKATSNSADITFDTATADWDTGGGIVTYGAVMDSVTHGAGNVLFAGTLTTAKAVTNGDTFKINAGDLDIALS